MKNEAAEGGNHAVRIRRLNESVFTSAPKLEAFGVKEKVQYMSFFVLLLLLKDLYTRVCMTTHFTSHPKKIVGWSIPNESKYTVQHQWSKTGCLVSFSLCATLVASV